jgi:Na+/proline symporter
VGAVAMVATGKGTGKQASTTTLVNVTLLCYLINSILFIFFYFLLFDDPLLFPSAATIFPSSFSLCLVPFATPTHCSLDHKKGNKRASFFALLVGLSHLTLGSAHSAFHEPLVWLDESMKESLKNSLK